MTFNVTQHRHAREATALIAPANTSLYQAKAAGKDPYHAPAFGPPITSVREAGLFSAPADAAFPATDQVADVFCMAPD